MTRSAPRMAKRGRSDRHHLLSILNDFIVIAFVLTGLLLCCRGKQIGKDKINVPPSVCPCHDPNSDDDDDFDNEDDDDDDDDDDDYGKQNVPFRRV